MEPIKRTAIDQSRDDHDRQEEEEDKDFYLPRHSQPTGYADYDSMDQATMESHIPETNMGYKLLQKMGWKAGQGLGSKGQGRVDPIRIDIKEDVLGVGKAEEEQAYHESSTAKRKIMGSEKQLEETIQERLLRETKVKEKELIQEELKEVKRAFYCELCDKQYNKVAEYEQHLQSYDHHHKKRFKDMKEQSRKSEYAQSIKDKKREKERKREERELKKMQDAMLKRANAAVKTSSPITTTTTTAAPLPNNQSNSSSSGSGGGGWSSVVKPGFSTIVPPTTTTTTNNKSTSSGGWTSSSTPINTKTTPEPVSGSNHMNNDTEKKPATKLSFGLPQKKSTGFRFNLKK
ncbi:G-patch domain-containing protein [Circinella umbellata]|nr:G-patch domain-containing protein [Circinella umbellata]